MMPAPKGSHGLKRRWNAFTDKFRQKNKPSAVGSQILREDAVSKLITTDAVPVRFEQKEEELLREKIRTSVECPICTDVFLDPVSLVCGHVFCLHCLAHDYARQDKGRLVCCICRDETTDNIVISRSLREVISNAFPQEELHRRETLTPSDRRAIVKLNQDQHKSPEAIKTQRFWIQARYGLFATVAFFIWFFYLD